ncbi:NCS2 family permease [Paenibacillus marinisediminis]
MVNWRNEIIAGCVSFFAVMYIIIVNATILVDAGIPLQAGMIATIIASAAGSILMGLWGKAPIVLIPGMGINAMFTYTLVNGMGLSVYQALFTVTASGVLFAIIVFTPLLNRLQSALPESLLEAVTVGIGLLLVLIGLSKGGIITSNPASIIALRSFAEPEPIVTMIALLITSILYIRKIPGALLIAIVLGTALAYAAGIRPSSGISGNIQAGWSEYGAAFGSLSPSGMPWLSFAAGVFALTLVLLFEHIGLLHAHLHTSGTSDRMRPALQASAISVIFSGIASTSPTVSAAESAAGVSAGGRTGWTAITAGLLFIVSLPTLPLLLLIPDQAVAPIIIFIGGLMMPPVRKIPFETLHEGIPAFFIIAFIPLMNSIIDGMAIGFVSYAVLHVAAGKRKSLPSTFYIIALLFIAYLILQAFIA